MRRLTPALMVFSMLALVLLLPAAHAEDALGDVYPSDSGGTCSVCDKCPLTKLLSGENPGWDAIDPRTWLNCFKCLGCIIQEFFNSLKNAMYTVAEAIRSVFETIWSAITYPFTLLKNAILSFVNGVKEVLNTIGVGVSNLGSKIVAAFSWLKDNVYVLLLAAAGVIAIRYALVG